MIYLQQVDDPPDVGGGALDVGPHHDAVADLVLDVVHRRGIVVLPPEHVVDPQGGARELDPLVVPLPAPVGRDISLALNGHLHDVHLQADLVQAYILLARALAPENDFSLARVAYAAVLLQAVSAHATRGLRLRRKGGRPRGGSLLLAVRVGDLGGYSVMS